MNPQAGRLCYKANLTNMDTSDLAQRLCLQCGLCCNGVMFGDVGVSEDDQPERLLSRGMPLQRHEGAWRFDQPCSALKCGACEIYAERPGYCAQFECSLLQETLKGRRTEAEAERIIARTRQLAERVRELLAERGETDETLSLSRRYQRFMDRHEVAAQSVAFRREHGGLMVAVMSLNQALKLSFYT